jgi:heme exporter protein D
MGHYAIYIALAYMTVFLGLVYMTVRYLRLNKRIQKSLNNK